MILKIGLNASSRGLLLLGWLLTPLILFGQQTLQAKFEAIESNIKGNLGINALLIETGESISLNGDKQFPMQSVYKFPIAMVMLKQVDEGKFSLEDTIQIDKAEYIPKRGYSPIREKFPEGARLTLKEIIRYNIESDGTACDVLLKLLRGTAQVQRHIHNLGITNIAIATTEMVQVVNDSVQYQNWATPVAMSKLFQLFHEGTYLSKSSQALLAEYMSVAAPWFDRRIKGLLPPNTKVIHKTGTSRTVEGFTGATNDAGIITLPDGRHLALSVFISDSYDDQKKREETIAKVSKAAFDYWTSDK